MTKIFYKSKVKGLFFLFISLLLALLGFYFIVKGVSHGYFGVILFGLGFIVAVIDFLPNSSYLKIEKKGFELSSLYRKTYVAWEDIEDLQLLNYYPFLGFNLGNTKISFKYFPNENRDIDNNLQKKKTVNTSISCDFKVNAKEIFNQMIKYKVDSK